MNKIKTAISLIDKELNVIKTIKEEISYEEYLVIKEEGKFGTTKFSEKNKYEELYIIVSIYSLDNKALITVVTRDKFKVEILKELIYKKDLTLNYNTNKQYAKN